MNNADRASYFNGTWYYPAEPWRESLCRNCRDNNLVCDFDAESNMCRQCRDPTLQQRLPLYCRRLCDAHRNSAHPQPDCTDCRIFTRRLCRVCKLSRPPKLCTFDGDGHCEQCLQSYRDGDIDREGCRELCSPCSGQNRPSEDCQRCVVHVIYRAPGKYPQKIFGWI